ncbi:MAG: InlB B-repeat-containing protein [Firmicutes bacterium]|nr:InlB B-repeat-containing protein [Bacillota bacterium]
MTKEDGWENQVFVNMLRYEEGKRNNWTMSVTDMEGDSIKDYEVTVTGSETEGFHAVLKHVPARITPDPEAEYYTIRYKLNGGSFDGNMEDIIEKYQAGSTITIHEAPVRDGYTFLYWKGSEYQPGDTYTVTEDHVFTAQWKKNSYPSEPDDPDDPDKPDKPTKPDTPDRGDPPAGNNTHTGDDNMLILWVALLLTSLLGIAGVIARYRR